MSGASTGTVTVKLAAVERATTTEPVEPPVAGSPRPSEIETLTFWVAISAVGGSMTTVITPTVLLVEASGGRYETLIAVD